MPLQELSKVVVRERGAEGGLLPVAVKNDAEQLAGSSNANALLVAQFVQPALHAKNALPILTICSAAGHGSQKVPVEMTLFHVCKNPRATQIQIRELGTYGVIGIHFCTVCEATYPPMLARLSTAMMTPPWKTKPRVVVPCKNLMFGSPLPSLNAVASRLQKNVILKEEERAIRNRRTACDPIQREEQSSPEKHPPRPLG
jgi:hypothetical protein